MGRHRAFEKSVVVDRAVEFFWEHGYAQSSLDDLVTYLGISRSSLYATWSGKAELFREAFQRYIDTIGLEALKPIFAGAASGATAEAAAHARRAVEAVFETIAWQVSHDPKHRGCLMVNTITELSATEPELAELAVEAQEQVRSLFREALQPLVGLGQKSAGEAIADADFLLATFAGLRVLARSGPSRSQADAVVSRALAVVYGRQA